VVEAYDGILQGVPSTMQPNLVSHLKLMRHLMLIMTLFVLSISLVKNVMTLLADVLNSFNKLGGFVGFGLNMCKFFLGSCKG